jgi:serine protease
MRRLKWQVVWLGWGVALVAAGCGGGGGGVSLPPPPPSPTPILPGTVQGTVTPEAGTVSSLQVRLPRSDQPRTAAGLPVYVPDQVLVKFRPTAQAQSVEALHQAAGGRVVRVIRQLGVHVVKLNPGISAASALAVYRASGLVEYAEQDAYVYALATPNDEYYSLQWHYPKIGLPTAWDVTIGGPVIVAVVDSGIRFDHPDLTGVTVPGYDFFGNDPDPTDPGCTAEPARPSHGTHVAGTVAALTNNSRGVAGVAWGGASAVRIMPIRVLGQVGSTCETGDWSALAAAVVYAADQGAKIINLSLGGHADLQVLRDAVSYALGRGVTLIAAAGNHLPGEPTSVAYPAAYPGVIAVAATACNDQKASYSNFGPEIWVAAPGGDVNTACPADTIYAWIWSTSWRPSDGFTYPYLGPLFVGTSMAAPHVSGVAALLISRGFTTPSAIRSRLRDTAVDLGAPGWDPYFGYGLVNAAAAVGASNPNSTMRAFAGVVSGNTITRQSDFAGVAATGSFTITNAQPGTKSVFAWQDFNGNGQVDLGDYFGRRDGVVISPGSTTFGVAVTVRRYTGSGLVVAGSSREVQVASAESFGLLLLAGLVLGVRRLRGG